MNSSELLLYKNPENREVFDCMLRIASEEFEIGRASCRERV